MLPFLKAIQPDLERVNTAILESLRSEEPLVEAIGHHLVNSGGKRLRPILALLSAKCCEYQGEHHVTVAAIVEFIHSATLLHDDVVDMSELRRGMPTANAEWGNAPSVLVGDFLYSRAFQMMVSVSSMDIMRILSNTTNTISEGEVQQLANAKNADLSEACYLDVIYKKTAALFEAACACGASVASSEEKHSQALAQFGYHLGLAFQLMDDLLDYSGDTETLGKNVGDDLAEGKATLPIIHALQHCSESEGELIRQSIKNADASKFTQIIDIIRCCGSLDYTQTKAREHAEQAIHSLNELPESRWRQCLIDLTHFSIERAY